MSIKINVNGKMLDMKEVIHGGRYTHESRNFGGLTGAGVPYGDGIHTDWCKPEKDFGITLYGQDLRHKYVAPHEDFYSTTNRNIPVNVNALKVVCIGGGGGGGGGASSHDTSGHYGTAGGGGGSGATVMGYIPVEGANNFYVEIGGGGSGSNRHYSWNHGRFGAEGTTPGNYSLVRINNSEVVAGGGWGGENHQPGVRHGNGGGGGNAWQNGSGRIDGQFARGGGGLTMNGGGGAPVHLGDGRFPQLDSNRGNGGQGGARGGNNDLDTRYCYGRRGQDGMCRVYFLY
jgi:hypothetical protein